MKARYTDDTYEGDRVYSKQSSGGFVTLTDKTTYSAKGEPINGSFFSTFSQGIQGMRSRTIEKDADGNVVETMDDGTKKTTIGSTETIVRWTDANGIAVSKVVRAINDSVYAAIS